MLLTFFIILLVLLLLGSFPAWPYSRSWGWGPSGLLVTVLVILLVVWAVTGTARF